MKIENFVVVKHFGFFEKESRIELANTDTVTTGFDSYESAVAWLKQQADCTVEKIESFFDKPQLVVSGSRLEENPNGDVKRKNTIKVFVEKENLLIEANYYNWLPFSKLEGYFVDVTSNVFSILKEHTEVYYTA